MKTPTQIDNEAREKIVNIDLNNMKNYFVIANAGSGKTSILVNRMVAMVEAGIDVSKICAITFTKNAASEFLNRFQEVLRDRADKSKTPDDYKSQYPGDLDTPSEATRSNCLKALKNINLCFLGTIDAFCNKVLSEFPLDANIPSSSQVLEETEELKLYKDEYEKISRNELSPIYAKFCNFDLLNSKSQEVFSNSIKSVIDATNLKLVFNPPKEDLKELLNNIIKKYEEKITDDIDLLLSMEDSACTYDGNNKDTNKFIDSFNSFKRSANYLKGKWKIENLISRINEIKNSVSNLRFEYAPDTSVIKFDFKEGKKASYSLYSTSDNELEDLIKELDNIKYSYSIDFLVSAKEIIKDNLRSLGKLTFTDYLIVFRDMLKKDMDNGMNIIRHIREKYSYFLIDESQDTSPFQTELFLYLTSSIKASKIEECKPIPGSLFILGDPKQSIYRFRGADVESYMRTKELFENVFDSNNEVLKMTKNFRSTDLLKDYFNEAFTNKLINYDPIPECKGIGSTSGLFTFTNYIDVIKTMLNNPDYKVMVKENNKRVERSPMFKDFMIITKSKFNHKEIINELNKNHIPVYVEGKLDIASANIVKSVYAIYKYLASEDLIDSGALYNLLTSPIFKLKIDEVMCKTFDNIPSSVKEYLNVIDSLKQEKNPIVLYEKILDTIKLFDRVEFYNMDYAYYILEQLKSSYSNALITDLNDAIILIEGFISESFERIMSMDYKPNAVYLANLHKVKGLEAPIVLLMKAGNSNRSQTIRCDYEKSNSYIFRCDEHPSKFGGSFYSIKTSEFEHEEELETNQAKLEEERLKYVAVTRARSYLLIDNSNSGFWNSIVNDNFKEFIVDSDKKIEFSEKDITNICKSVTTHFDNTNTYKTESPSKLELERVVNVYSTDSQLIDSNYDAKLKGTIIHRLMEILVNSKCMIKKDELIYQISSEYNFSRIPDSKKYIDMLGSVYDTMISGGYHQENGRDSDILEILKYAKCYCEVPFSYTEGNKVWYGNIDLLYELNGKYYIVDYKTNLDGKDLEKEYKNQLEAYKKSLKTIENIDAETYIYHIDVK